MDPAAETSDRQVLAYFGHHKCASTWIANIVSRVCADIGLRHYFALDSLTPWSTGPLTDYRSTFDRSALRQQADAAAADFVTCMTADSQQATVLRPARAFHVIRDPRDIIVSAYFSHRNSHPTEGLPHLQDHRERLRSISLQAGLLAEMEFSKTELRQIGDWNYTDPATLEVKMEELVSHPYDEFTRIFQHLGLMRSVDPVEAKDQLRVWLQRLSNRLSSRRGLGHLHRRIPATGELVLGTVYAWRFDAQTGGRARGNEDPGSHYRKGITGDWVNYFTAEHTEAFQELFGDLLAHLGYERGQEGLRATEGRR